MTGGDIVERFERGKIGEDAFHHADHVHLAFAYLSRYPTLQALEKFTCALKRFAAGCGKAQRYHETITFAYFFLIHERMARSEGEDWEEFARRNPDLLLWQGGILSSYYRETTLQSELARTVFVFPDRCG